MIEHARRREMENNIYLYEGLLGMTRMVEIMSAICEEKLEREEREKERAKDDVPCPSSSVHSSSPSSSNHSNEEIN